MSMASRVLGHGGVDQPLQSGAAPAQQQLGAGHLAHRDVPRVWITTREAQDVIGSKTLVGTYTWLRRHGIVRRQNGTVSRLDILRELKRKSRRGRSPNSHNLPSVTR